jgi:hypothetical protein
LTYQNVLNAILQSDGDNTYRLPHMGKDKILNRDMCLPRRVNAWDYLEVVDLDFDEDDENSLGFEAQDYDKEVEISDDDTTVTEIDEIENGDESTVTEDDNCSTITADSFDYQDLV